MSDTTEIYTATQVKADEPQPEVEIKEVDPHAGMRASIAEKYERARLEQIAKDREQMGLPPEEGAQPVEQEAHTEAVEPEQEPEAEAALEAAPEPVAPPAPPQTAPQPVQPTLYPMPLPDGRMTWVTAEQAAQLARIGAAAAYQPPAPPAPAAPPPPVLDADRARTISQRLQYGTPEEQTQALVEFAEAVRPSAPQVDVDAIRRQVLQEVRAQNQLDHNLNVLGTEYPEIFRDQVLTQVAALQLHQLRGNPLNAQKSDLDLYREACNEVRTRLAPPQSQPGNQVATAPQAAPVSARHERKRAAPSIPVGMDTRMPSAPAEPPPPTASETIAWMRMKRNQPAIT